MKDDGADSCGKTVAWLRRIRADARRALDRLLGEDPASTLWLAEDWLPEDVPKRPFVAAAAPARPKRAA